MKQGHVKEAGDLDVRVENKLLNTVQCYARVFVQRQVLLEHIFELFVGCLDRKTYEVGQVTLSEDRVENLARTSLKILLYPFFLVSFELQHAALLTLVKYLTRLSSNFDLFLLFGLVCISDHFLTVEFLRNTNSKTYFYVFRVYKGVIVGLLLKEQLRISPLFCFY